ncbi:MAG: dTMP kinase [Planctomycetota bacterium]
MSDRILKEKVSGRFIVLDGPDGCGKSTQVELLAKWLAGRGMQVAVFRDPGTTDIGEKIRKILLATEHTAMSTRTELLLYMAARAQLWHEKIKPALNQNKCVILDRWLSSSCAYQGYAGRLGMDKVLKIAEDSLERSLPDLTVILDIDIETARSRLKAQPDRMERKAVAYHNMVREGFLVLAEEHEGFVVIDASAEVETVQGKIIEIIKNI